MLPRTLKRALAKILNTDVIVPFMLGVVGLNLASNAVYSLLTNSLGTGTGSLVGILGVSLAILIFAVLLVEPVLRRLRSTDLDPKKKRPEPRRGLIFLVSKNEEVFREAFRPHHSTVERVWLVCSKQSLLLARKLGAELRQDGRIVEELIVRNVQDPVEFYRLVRETHANLPAGWAVTDVIGDYVGMTAHASVGMVLACLSSGAPMQYTPADYDENLKPKGPLPSFEVMIRVRPASKESPPLDHQQERRSAEELSKAG